MVDVNRLRVLRAVIASGSVNAAATNLGYTPSAISQHLSALAKETKLTLFEKSGRGIAPTAAGLELASRSEELMGSLARLDGAIEDMQQGRTERLAVSSFASAAEEWMPSIAAKVLDEFPDVMFTFRLNENGVEETGSPDIDIRTEVIESEPIKLMGYERHLLATEPYVALLPSDHPLAGEKQLRMDQLAHERWVNAEPVDTICGLIVRQAAQSAGFTLRFAAYAGDHHGGIAFVSAGIGVAVIPQLAAGNLPTTVVAVPLIDPCPRRRIVALVHRQAMLKPAARRVVELLMDRCTQVA